MTVRGFFIGLAGVAVVIAIVVFIAHVLGFGFIRTSNPPVIVVGGSIHGKYGSSQWNPKQSTGQEYWAKTPDSSLIYAEDVLDSQGNAVAQLNPASSGWIIKFYDPNYAAGGEGVWLCTDQACDGGGGDGKTVYLQAEAKTSLELVKNYSEVHFHNLNTGCDNATGSEDKKCDHVDHIGFIAGSAKEVRYECGGQSTLQGVCKIRIGQPFP